MIIIEPSNVWTVVYYDFNSPKILNEILDNELKVDVPSAQYLYAYKSGAWDGKAVLWKNFQGQVPLHTAGFLIRTGLIPRLINLFNKHKLEWIKGLDFRALPLNYTLKLSQVPLRNYQYDAIKTAFENQNADFGWWPRGVLALATGAGKTEIAVAMYEMNKVPTLFLVHRKDLMLQVKERFEKYGHIPGLIGDGKFEVKPNLNIATMQTISKIIKESDTARAQTIFNVLDKTQQVFFDESHLMASSLDKGNQFVEVADHIPAKFRWGLTATPFMRTQYDNLLLESVTGQALYRISSKELIDLGYLTPPKVIIKHVPGTLQVSFDWKKAKSTKERSKYWRKVEEKGIKFNEFRTKLIIEETINGPYPVLVLVKTKEQAEFIRALHPNNIPFICGKDSSKTRKEYVNKLRNGTTHILITTLFDEGIDIPELKKIILASGGKSEVKTIQRVGRSIRNAVGKIEALVIDFDDKHHPMLEKHSNERITTYKEQEFKIVYEKSK